MRSRLTRILRAQLRDAKVIFLEFRGSLLLFVLIVIGGGSLLHLFYTHPESGQQPDFSRALYAAFSMIFFDIQLPFPEQTALQALYFLIPILGLAAVADGVLRFSGALLSKQARGQKWQIAMASTYKNHVIVCGLGKVGYRVILELLKFGREVVAIEANPEGRFVEKVKELGVPIILADARRSENTRKAGVETAQAIIPCTDNELANLDIALDAHEINPKINVVMRMFDSDLARRVEKGFGIQTAFSTSALSAPIFASAAMGLNVRHSFYVGDDLLHLGEIEIQPGAALTQWDVARLERELDLSVVCLQSDSCPNLHPDDAQKLEANTLILVLTTLETLRKVHALNTPKG
jgi:Trk K+ transport system NAD-binding subunit